MTYIVSAAGRVAYRADWTDAHSIEWVLEYLRHESVERATTRRVAPFYAELAGHRSAMDYPRVFVEGLARGGGVRAVEEFISAVEERRGKGGGRPDAARMVTDQRAGAGAPVRRLISVGWFVRPEIGASASSTSGRTRCPLPGARGASA